MLDIINSYLPHVLILLKLFFVTFALSLATDLARTIVEIIIHITKKKFLQERKSIVLSPKDVLIVIPCHNSEDVIEGTLNSLPSDYTVVCVTNACTDATIPTIASFIKNNPTRKIEHLDTSKAGKILAVMIGAKYAKANNYKRFLLLDDDIIWSKDVPISIFKDCAITALPVIPTEGSGFLREGQLIEYHMMCVSKYAQSALGNVIMCSGAAGIYNTETFIDLMKHHDGEHIGDDLQCSYIHHTFHEKIDFYDRVVVQTHPPETLKQLWKQRAKRWEVSPIHNWYWLIRSLFARDLGWWLRIGIAYRIFVFGNDIIRVISFPIVLLTTPVVLLGIFFITYLSILVRTFIHRAFFSSYYLEVQKSSPFKLKRILQYPLYMFLLWLTRLYAIPLGLRQIYIYWIRGKRKRVKGKLLED